ncbi:acetolactate synthase-1/2/3 large subunit [Auritidibacter ignavus]|nr:acetolactate synthase-1/2/3 large subunit [Auritidibacter ignavus]
MAIAEGRLTGRAGVVMVTRGPGAANFFIAAHCAYQDATPLVCFIGLVPISDRRRESFQEFSIDNWFGSTVKRVFTIEDPDQAGEIVSQAFQIAESGRPGPVVVGLPENLLREVVEREPAPRRASSDSIMSDSAIQEFSQKVRASARPLVVVGGDNFFGDTGQRLADWSLEQHIPVVADWRNYDAIPNDHPAYVGWLGYGRRQSVVEALRECDLMIGVGAVRSDVMSEGYTVGFGATTVLINSDADVLQHAGRVDQLIHLSPKEFIDCVEGLDGISGNRGPERTQDLRRSHERFSSETGQPVPSVGVDIERAFKKLEEGLPQDRVITYGAGNATIWGHRLLSHTVPNSLVASRNGAMGMAVPAAVASSLIKPDATVLAVCGDGDFMMNGQEIATLVAQKSKAIFVVVDNSVFATIVEHQQRWYPNRPSGTGMTNPNFAELMRSYGGYGVRISDNSNLDEEIAKALGQDGPVLIHLVQDPEMMSPSGAEY